MNENPDDSDPLDRLLRASAPTDLPDNGFSRRVLAALPARRHGDWINSWWVPAAGAAVGLALCLWQGASVTGLADEVGQLGSTLSDTTVALAIAVVAGALVLLPAREG